MEDQNVTQNFNLLGERFLDFLLYVAFLLKCSPGSMPLKSDF